MIRKLIVAFFLLGLGAGMMYYGLGRHFVKTDEGMLVIPKERMTLTDTYADVREWEADDFKTHAPLTRALLEHGHEDVVAKAAGDTVTDLLNKATEWLKSKTEQDPEE